MQTVSLRSLLNSENSKAMATRVRDIVVDDPIRMDELMELFFSIDLRECQRASWPLGMIADRDTAILRPYLQRMTDNLDHAVHDAVIRNTFRTFQSIDFPEEVEGEIYEKSYQFFADSEQAIAIRVFAMTVCGNIAIKYPELQEEIISLIEAHYPHGSAGFKSRAKRIIREFGK